MSPFFSWLARPGEGWRLGHSGKRLPTLCGGSELLDTLRWDWIEQMDGQN